MKKFTEIKQEIDEIIENVENFKIGKSHKNLEDTFREYYSGTFKHRRKIASSNNKTTIDSLPEYLLKIYMYNDHCVNKQPIGMTLEDSDEYIIYIVWN